ncbi:MAG: EamA family transporter [Bacillaceae bacterium]|nr:EamA family transporter [Bacillaceae bacterium]
MRRSIIFIMLGAGLWGTIGWYVKNLYAYGFTPIEVVTLRAFTTVIFLFVYFALTEPTVLKLKQFSHVRYFIGTGIFSIVFFNFCMFSAIEASTIPVATALLYTAPVFVTIMSRFLFKELFTAAKLIALIFSLTGTVLVIELIPLNLDRINLSALLFGLGSGFGYALYSIFGKYALVTYNTKTITFYTFIVASIALIPAFPYESIETLLQFKVLFIAFGLGIFPTALAYLLYTYGLTNVEASKASIFTTVEPLVATLIGISVFHETFSFVQGIGMVLIIGAVWLLEAVQSKKSSFRKATRTKKEAGT